MEEDPAQSHISLMVCWLLLEVAKVVLLTCCTETRMILQTHLSSNKEPQVCCVLLLQIIIRC